MNITLPAGMKKWAQDQAAKRGFDIDSFFLELLRREKNTDAHERVEQMLVDGINSGESTPVTPATWERIRAKGRKLAKERRRK